VDKNRRSNRCSETALGRSALPGLTRSTGFPRLAALGFCVTFALSLACGASYVAVTALELPDASRQPDGVVVEPSPAVPPAEDRATAAEGVVALQAPLGGEAVVTVVHRLFRAFAHEDVEALQAILTDDAVVLPDAQGARGNGAGSLLDQWRTRLKNPAYTRLAAAGTSDIVDVEHLGRFTYEDLGGAGAPQRPPAMKPGELLVRFAIAVPTPRVGAERLFGDAMTLLLRRDGRTYKIAGLGEENPP
jgi:hypothetical protein